MSTLCVRIPQDRILAHATLHIQEMVQHVYLVRKYYACDLPKFRQIQIEVYTMKFKTFSTNL